MGVNSLPKTVTRQRRDCDLNPGPSIRAWVQQADPSVTEPPIGGWWEYTSTTYERWQDAVDNIDVRKIDSGIFRCLVLPTRVDLHYITTLHNYISLEV